MWPIKTCLFFLGFIGACALSLAHPLVGLINYIMVYQLDPNTAWWGRPLAWLEIRYALTAGICLLLGMLISSARVPRTRRVLDNWELLLLLFALLTVVSELIGVGEAPDAVLLIDKFAKMVVFVLCLTRLASTRANFMAVLGTLVAGCLVIGYNAYDAPASDFFQGRLNSVGGPDFSHSSGLAAHMSAMLPLVGVVFLIIRRWWLKIPVALAGILTVNTIVQCRTRSAFVGLAVGALVAVVLAPRRRRAKVYASLLLAAFGAYALTDNYFVERMATILSPAQYDQDRAVQGRLALWVVAGRMVAEHPFGVGIGHFRFIIDEFSDWKLYQDFGDPRKTTHNTYLLCATELGIQGGIVFLLLVSTSFWRLRQASRLAGQSADPQSSRLLAFGCTIALVIYLVSAAFTDRLYTESFWWVLALPICLERVVRREVAAVEAVPELLDRAEAWCSPPGGSDVAEATAANARRAFA